MVSASRVIDPSLQISYVARNGGSTRFHSFIKTQGAVGNSKTELESSWLLQKGGSGDILTVQWGTYLDSKGFTTGSIEERMRSFFLTGTQA